MWQFLYLLPFSVAISAFGCHISLRPAADMTTSGRYVSISLNIRPWAGYRPLPIWGGGRGGKMVAVF